MTATPADPVDLLVAVGTDHHPFDRMVDWISPWVRAHPDVSVMVQTGTAAPAPPDVASVDYLPFETMAALLASARVIVCHGGAATMMEVRRAGHLPIVVARDPGLGEHVDDHQQRHTRMLAERGEISLATSREDLWSRIDRALSEPSSFLVEAGRGAAPEVVQEYGRLIEHLVGHPSSRRERATGGHRP